MFNSESKSFLGDYHEMAHMWARMQAFDQVFKSLFQKFCDLYYKTS